MHNLNIDENEVLRNALSGLNEDVPPMPEGLHTAWMQKVEEDMEEKRIEKTRSRKSIVRFLSVAAAMVFVVGGTLLTRDDLRRRTTLEAAYSQLVEENDKLVLRASYADEFKPTLASYKAMEDSLDLESIMAAPKTAAGAATVSNVTMARNTANSAQPDMAMDDMIVTEEASVTESGISDKKIIRTANLTIQTQTYDNSLTNLRALCEADGGWVESSSESVSSSTGLRTARLTLRVPQTGLDGYLAGAEQLGRITSRSESATDVTASYQDTKARLDTQLALMARLQALITESADLSDLLALESQIADTQYMIDSLQSSLNTTDRQVTYSAVSVTLREEKAPALTDTSVSLGDRLAAAVRMGCEGIVTFAQDALVFILAALPYLAVVAVIIGGVIIIRKLRRRNK